MFKVQAMATGLSDAAKPRRYDLTMSRRTRRPATATANAVADCCQDQGKDAEPEKCTQLKELFQCPCPAAATDELQSQQPEDTQEHRALQRSEDVQEETTEQSLEEDEPRHQQQQEQQQWLQSEDNSRRLSLQELIDETINGEKDAVTGSQEESSAAAAAAAVQGVAEADETAASKQPEHVAGRRKVIGMMRRYVRVRSIKPRPAPETNAAPIC